MALTVSQMLSGFASSTMAAETGKVNYVISHEAPTVKNLVKAPKTPLVVGNSYTYYNCGLNGYLSNFLIGDAIVSGQAKDEKEARKSFKTRIATIGRGNLSQYPVAEYLDNTIVNNSRHKSRVVYEDVLCSALFVDDTERIRLTGNHAT